jgi:hypothetical protein
MAATVGQADDIKVFKRCELKSEAGAAPVDPLD